MTAPGIVLRVSPGAGTVRLYRGRRLDEASGAVAGRFPPVVDLVGADPDGEVLFARTAKREVLALDLTGRRVDTVAVNVASAGVGAEGTLLAVDQDGRVVSLAHGSRLVWTQSVPRTLRKMFVASYGGVDARLIAVVPGDPARLVVASSDQPSAARAIPLGATEASRWGDLVAVATDSGVTLVDPTGRLAPAFVRLPDAPRALAFSPSGHRLYVARRQTPGVAVIDRYERREMDGIALPFEATALRVDPLGRWLAVRPERGDSVWVVDLAARQPVGAVSGEWADDLPAFTPDGALLARVGDDVVAYRPDSLRVTGRVEGAADDLWLVALWGPRSRLGSRPSPGALTAAAGGVDTTAGPGPIYVQVSFSQNQAWAADLATSLSRASLPAHVLPATAPDEGFRVVLGPYRTRVEAEAIGRKLGRPHTIYEPAQP